MISPHLDFVLNPLRTLLGVTEHKAAEVAPVRKTEEEMPDVVRALERVAKSVERHVEVIEQLATSIDPLKESVNNLTATMNALVKILGPIATVEHEVHGVERFFGRHHHADPADLPHD